MKVPEFDHAYREARRAAFRQSVARLRQASGVEVNTVLNSVPPDLVIPMPGTRPAESDVTPGNHEN